MKTPMARWTGITGMCLLLFTVAGLTPGRADDDYRYQRDRGNSGLSIRLEYNGQSQSGRYGGYSGSVNYGRDYDRDHRYRDHAYEDAHRYADHRDRDDHRYADHRAQEGYRSYDHQAREEHQYLDHRAEDAHRYRDHQDRDAHRYRDYR